jgi:hypothetical protein
MSRYRRSVRCRHCGESGHNINGCAKVKEYAKNNPNSYTAEKMKARQEAMQHRKCSYCGEEKHTRRTCTQIMSDMVKVAAINIDFRKKALETINRVGLAPGALISVTETSGYDQAGTYHYDKRDQLALVTRIDMDDLRALNSERGCQFVRVQFMSMYDYGGKRLAETSIHIPNWFLLGRESAPVSNGYWRDTLGFKVVSPGHHVIENEDEWIRNKDVIKQICDNLGDHRSVEYAIDAHNKYC